MPPRIVVAAIIAFWLAMTGLLIHREVVPMMIADVSPSFTPDLTDEIGSPLVGWTVKRGDDRIGSGTSRVIANDDGKYEFRSTFHFDDLAVGPAHIRLMENMYRVTEDGKLVAVATKVSLNLSKNRNILAQPDLSFGIQGDVVDSIFSPVVTIEGKEFELDKVNMPQEGSIINPMHLVNRLRGLRAGQTWKINMIDPFRGLRDKFMGDLATGKRIPALIAEVKAESLTWNKKEVACLVIEYREPGKEVIAKTWVRKSDGLVLRQDADHLGFKMILERVAN
jgi:hypothetical protein